MANIRTLDPSASPLDYYGSELRRERERAGMTQGQLGGCLFCAASLIGQIETAMKVPTRDFSERLDAALGTEGRFSRLVGLVLRSQLPCWFQQYAEMEARATYISTYQAQVVYGLLQTKEYAEALVAAHSPDELETLVAARLERQRILERDTPPALWVVLDEAVLYRQVGGKNVMRQQLAHLLSVCERPWTYLQVLPFSVGEHPATLGSFNLLRFEDDPDLFYSESYDIGHMSANAPLIRERSVSYARLQATALSPEDSAALIARVMEERYGPDGRAVA
ncbi:helix-turn-helix transcriptional regulator [Streptomyces sp. TLI_146]|uniref:helix-turn-helix domain-containing protein n=1 Tax=Streptomyces sp. TLI_146 TaxID=1938858 RepID=UPI000C6FE4A3|nr:helix-turn-helix transcriptional regulator [Streptomyces sp. TLI_146]PKV85741.1 helix-turn-helix protein [Streptomyces sp. TLI_146]